MIRMPGVFIASHDLALTQTLVGGISKDGSTVRLSIREKSKLEKKNGG